MSNVNNLINAWLDENIVAEYVGSISSKWRKFLEQEGYTKVSLLENQYDYFGDEGYTGPYNKRYKQWLAAEIYT